MLTSSLRSLSRRVSRSRHLAAAPARFMSRWSHVPEGPKDPILGVSEAFNADTDSRKLNLGVGAYRDDDGKPTVLKSVELAQAQIVAQVPPNEYAPIGGEKAFVDTALKLAYGEDCAPLKEGRYTALQSLSGTGALRLAAAFMQRFKPMKVFVPSPTWGNHFKIFEDSGLEVETYAYYDANTKGLNLQGLLADIDQAPDGSAFVMHACAHNPTGVDPTIEQWKEISQALKAKGHFVLVDSAYQGFASGDPRKDAAAIEILVNDGHQIGLSQSFAKNFGLYGHRVGTFSLLLDDTSEVAAVESQLKILARGIYSSPPIHGSRIVHTILTDKALYDQWLLDIKEMADRIITMRRLLVDNLASAGSTLDWSHITDQIGMFCFSGMTPEQVAKLVNEHHIYLTSNGRISMAGVTSKNVGYLAEAMHKVTSK